MDLKKAAIEYGSIRAKLEKTGQPIGANDMLIASHAKSLDCTIVTNNTKEFERVQALKIQNWV
jgi:tRNA(fMet)-specific endonuclease VapC